MFSKALSIGSLLLTGVLASAGAPAHADNINTSGVICRNFNASQALDIDYFTRGVRNIATSSRVVICSVPRSPLASSLILPIFTITGTNNVGTSTSCTVTVHNHTVKTTSSFTSPDGSWTRNVIFPSSALDSDDHVSLMCTLPANGAGILHGVISVQ